MNSNIKNSNIFQKETLKALNSMIDKKFLVKNFSTQVDTWIEEVNSANSISRLRFLYSTLYLNINWKKSTEYHECQICHINYETLSEEFLIDPANLMKGICSRCSICYHLSCAVREPSTMADSENNVGITCHGFKVMKCLKCHQEQVKLKQAELRKAEEDIKINSIVVVSHSLRFNKSRKEM